MNNNNISETIFLANYKASICKILHIDLNFILNEANTIVKSTLHIQKQDNTNKLTLDAYELELLNIYDEKANIPSYKLTDTSLEIDISAYEDNFILHIQNKISPVNNTHLMGLYLSNKRFFTQCEPQGFRRITYFIDRPDVMATYTVKIEADKSKYPILLSNGNLIEQGELQNNKHYVIWHDPFPKPSYLFALVAGNLVCNEAYVEFSNGIKQLQIWVEPQDIDKTQHAMNSLIKSIKWDEDYYQRQLDLDRFMIVAVSDFNMGAMENKGLNIFNSKYILANPKSATDKDYYNIESIIAHEYFHNWTGNRITCRDWFQLSLKEGLTVFRDQCFSQTQASANQQSKYNIERIKQVNSLKQIQFLEDNGAMRHAVQPQSYQEINNFYTATIYNKGAEIVRMYHTLLGEQGFQKGMQLYFNRFDGQAVTCQDFLACMSEANNKDLSQFNLWYTQISTPNIKVTSNYNSSTQEYTLHFIQSTPLEPTNKPYYIPIKIALINSEGMPILINNQPEIILELSQSEQSFTFNHILSLPTPSLLRNFSAPVILNYDYSYKELLHLLNYDNDGFNRWEACQKLWLKTLAELVVYFENQLINIEVEIAPIIISIEDAKNLPQNILTSINNLIDILHNLLKLNKENIHNIGQAEYADFLALLCTIPSSASIIEYMLQHNKKINPHAINLARQSIELLFSHKYINTWEDIYNNIYTNLNSNYIYEDYPWRNLQNLCLYYISITGNLDYAYNQYYKSQHLTNSIGSLQATLRVQYINDIGLSCLEDFYNKNQDNPLCIDKWFTLNTQAIYNTSLQKITQINQLVNHEQFNFTNPNRLRSVLMVFFKDNISFHTPQGYDLWAKIVILLDIKNPSLAADIVKIMQQVHAYSTQYEKLMLDAIKNIYDKVQSKDVLEILNKIYLNSI